MPLIVDTTAWSKLKQAPEGVQDDFFAAFAAGLLVSSPVVRLEFLHDARDGDEFDERDELFSELREVPVTEGVGQSAVGALRDLRRQGSPGYHRVKAGDALIAASAAERGFNVLHDDAHFDKLSEVLGFAPMRLVQ